MTSDLDVYRSAHLLIKEHGLDAAIYAAMRADQLLDNGDVDGHFVWVRIKKAIDELQSVTRPPQANEH